MRFRPVLTTTLIAVLTAPLRAQTGAQPTPEELQRATALMSQGNWEAASQAFAALAKTYPTHGLSRFRYGVTLMELGKFPEAETSMRQGEAMGVPPGQASYRLAQLYAEMKRPDSALAFLRRALKNQFFTTPSALAADKHLASLVSHPQWNDVVKAFDAVARPCMYDSRYREFDFWIGDWDVRPVSAPANAPPARNTVTLNYNGCVVMEHWKAPGGSEGESYNLFDRSYGEWRQTWVDNTGGQHDYRGKLVGKDIVYTGTIPAPGGAPGRRMAKLTFFNLSPDSVRQFSQTSADSGKTWQTAYDLLYVRRK